MSLLELNFVDINSGQVFENILTTHLFPALRSVMKSAKQALRDKLSNPQKKVLLDVLKSLTEIEGPPSLSTDIKTLMKRFKT